MEMIIVVKSDHECFLTSVVESKRRLEEVKSSAISANERWFEILLNCDPTDEKLSTDEQIKNQEKIDEVEADVEAAWDKYEKAWVRYSYDLEQARKKGLIA
jgi:hypothetical protein